MPQFSPELLQALQARRAELAQGGAQGGQPGAGATPPQTPAPQGAAVPQPPQQPPAPSQAPAGMPSGNTAGMANAGQKAASINDPEVTTAAKVLIAKLLKHI